MNFLTKIIKSTKIDDFRTILLIFSLLVILFLAYKNYTSIDNSDLIKKLKEDRELIEKERNSIRLEIDSLKNQNSVLLNEKGDLLDNIKRNSDLINKYIYQAKQSKMDLDRFKKEYESINKRIDDFTPPNRQDEQLIISLRNHLDKRMKNK
jgi:septal ring factor EnvC (AmiA/AmiB activator)